MKMRILPLLGCVFSCGEDGVVVDPTEGSTSAAASTALPEPASATTSDEDAGSRGLDSTTDLPPPPTSDATGITDGAVSSSSETGAETGAETGPECDEELPAPPRLSGDPVEARTLDEGARIGAVAVDGTGQRLIGGLFDTTITFGDVVFEQVDDGPEIDDEDGFVASLQPDGSLAWIAMIHGSGHQDAMAIATDDAGDVFVQGIYAGALLFDGVDSGAPILTGTSGAYFAKLDGVSGAVKWSHALTPAGIGTIADPEVLATNDGGLVVATEAGGFPVVDWWLDDAPAFQAAAAALYVARFDAAGDLQWAHTAAPQGGLFISPRGLAIHDDAVLIGGHAPSPAIDIGDGELQSGRDETSFLATIDPAGELEASVIDGGALRLADLAAGPCGDIVLVGTLEGPVDLGDGLLGDEGAFVARRTWAGEHAWSMQLADATWGEQTVAIDAAGFTIVRWGDASQQPVVTKLGPDGARIWDRPYVDNVGGGVGGPVVDGLARVVVAGNFVDTLSVPGLPAVVDAGVHGYLLELHP